MLQSDQSWKDWNYYQLLGLFPDDYYYPRTFKGTGKKDKWKQKQKQKDGSTTSASSGSAEKGCWSLKSRRERKKERDKIELKEIKKSYRKQAQAWHPDKIAARKRQQKATTSNSTKSNGSVSADGNASGSGNGNGNGVDYSNVSVEECNARFAKIAEAYEVLNDEEKRQDYDTFLLDAEEEMDLENRLQICRDGFSDNENDGSGKGALTTLNELYEKTNSFFQEHFTDPISMFEDFFFGGGESSSSSSSTKGGSANSEENNKNFMDDLFESFYGGSSSNNNQQRSQSGDYENRQPDRTSETTQIRYDPRMGREVLNVYQREEFDEPRERRIYYRVIAQEFVQEMDYYGRPIGYSPVSDPRIIEEGHVPMKDKGKKDRKQNARRRTLSLTSHRLEKYEFMTPQTLHLHSLNGEYYAGLTSECELVIIHDQGPFEEDDQVWTSNTYVPPNHHRDGCALAMYGARIAIIVGDVEHPSTFLWTSPPPPPIVPGSFDGEESIDFYLSLDDDGSLVVYRSRKQGDGERIEECVYATGLAGCNSAGRRFVNISNTILRSVENLVSQIDGKVGGILDSLNEDRNNGIPFVDMVKTRLHTTALKIKKMYGLYLPKLVQFFKHMKHRFKKLSSRVDEKVSDIMDSLYEIGEDDVDLLDTVLCILGKGFQNVLNMLK